MTPFAFRKAEVRDVRLLYHWVNSSDSLKWKQKTAGKISISNHVNWFRRVCHDPSADIWIVENGAGSPLGQIRLQGAEGVKTVDVYFLPSARGTGISCAAFEEILNTQYTKDCFSLQAIIASQNIASVKYFEKLGFRTHVIEPSDPNWVCKQRMWVGDEV